MLNLHYQKYKVLTNMGNFISNFATIGELNAFKQTSNYKTPHISLTKDNRKITYINFSYYDKYLTFIALEDGTFSFSKAINYSINNGNTWVSLEANTNTPTILAGNRILWKAELIPDLSNGIGTFSATGNFNAEGNIMSLLYGDNFIGQTSLSGKDYTFYKLFFNCSKLISAKNLCLPATTLAYYCYYYMFSNCTSLTTAPELPATTLTDYCYNYMFNGCKSLSYIKALFITTPASYYTSNWVNGVASSGVFVKNNVASWTTTGASGIPSNWKIITTEKNITDTTQLLSPSYVTISNVDNIVFIKKSSYQTVYISNDRQNWETMIENIIYNSSNSKTIYICGILSNANTASNYTQFHISGNNVTMTGNLNSIWSYDNVNESLKAYCGFSMFQGCTSLVTAPELPATTLAENCYNCMFYDCKSLTTAPELPATTLAFYCYNSMFYGCTSLTTAPELPATTLVSYCYSFMFKDCTSLGYIKAMFTTTPSTSYTNSWVSGVAASGTFVKNSSAEWDVTGGEGIPSGWTVETASA